MKTTTYEKTIVISDIHIPFQDDRVIDLVFKFMKWFKPDMVVINGDLVDMWECSKFDKSPKMGKSLVDEIKEARALLKRLRSIVGDKCKIVYVYGNHDFRWESFLIRQAPQLIGLDGLTLADQLHLDELKIQVEYSGLRESYFKYGDLYIGHWDKVSKHSGYTAKGLVDDKGVNVIQAHVHRTGSHFRTMTDDRVLMGIEQGCLCDLKPNYLLNPNWQHGFVVVYKQKGESRFSAFPIPIIRYKFFFGDQEWS